MIYYRVNHNDILQHLQHFSCEPSPAQAAAVYSLAYFQTMRQVSLLVWTLESPCGTRDKMLYITLAEVDTLRSGGSWPAFACLVCPYCPMLRFRKNPATCSLKFVPLEDWVPGVVRHLMSRLVKSHVSSGLWVQYVVDNLLQECT